MITFRTIVSTVSVIGSLNVATLEAQRTAGPPASPRVLVTVTADARAVLSFDRSTVLDVSPERPTEVRVSPGRYRLRAATGDGNAYWEQLVVVRPDGPSTVNIAFADALRRRVAEEDVLDLLKSQRVVKDREVQTVRAQIDSSRSRVKTAQSAAAGQDSVALQRVEATMKAIGSLEPGADR